MSAATYALGLAGQADEFKREAALVALMLIIIIIIIIIIINNNICFSI